MRVNSSGQMSSREKNCGTYILVQKVLFFYREFELSTQKGFRSTFNPYISRTSSSPLSLVLCYETMMPEAQSAVPKAHGPVNGEVEHQRHCLTINAIRSGGRRRNG